jgi:hypothetical protein
MKRKLILILVFIFLLSAPNVSAIAAIDLQADMNRIVAGIKQFDANSANSASANTLNAVKRIFSNNASILREIGNANSAFKRDLNSAKRQIPSRDTKESPAFNTLMNLAKGYEGWLKYQNMNQSASEKCIKSAGNSLNSYTICAIALLPKAAEHERIGRQKLQAAWDAWKQWQVKFGYA